MNENIFSQSNSSTFNFDNSISTTNLILTTLKSDDSVPPHYEQQQQQKQHQQCDEDQKSLSPTLTTSTTTAIPSIMVNKKGEMSSYSDFSQIHMDRGNCSDNSSSNESVDINIPKEMTSSSPLSLSSSFSLTGEYKDYSTITAATTSINTVNLTNDKCSDTNDQFDKPLLNFINHTINNTGLGKTEKTVNQEMSTQDTFSSLKSIPGKNLFPGIINHNIDSINKSEVEHTEHLGGFIQNQTTWNALSMAYSSLIASGLYGLNNKSTSTVNHSTNTPIDKFQSLLQCHSIPSLLKQRSLLPTCESLSSGITSTTISSSSTIPPLPSSLFLSNSLGRIHSGDLSHQFISPANETVTSNNNNNNKNFATPKVHQENSANEFNLPAIMNNLLVENLEGWRQLQKTGLPSNIDPQMLTFYAGACCPVELSNTNRRKNATRETTSMLKTWLNEHRKNPYPTKGEKIMLALITKMSLTQVSTWFANARRRLKKENKVTWNLRTDCSSDVEHDDEHSVEDGDGDDDNDFVDNSTITSKATTTTADNQNRLSNEHDLQTITGLQGLKHYLISKHSENYEKFSMSSNKLLFNKEGCTNLITEGNKNKISRLRNFPNPCDQIDTIPKKRINLDYNNSSISSLPTPTSEKSKTRKIWSLVDMVDEKTNHSNVESINEKNPLDLQNTSCDNWLTQGNKNLQSQHFFKTPTELSTYQLDVGSLTSDCLSDNPDDSMNRKSKNLLSSFSNFTAPPVVTGGVTSISNTGQQLVNNFSTGSSSLFSPNTLAAFYLYYQQHQLQQSQEHNQSSLSSSTTLHQHLSHEQPKSCMPKFPIPPSHVNNPPLYSKSMAQKDDNFSILFHNSTNNLDLLNRETQQYARSLSMHKSYSNQQITTSPSDES